MIDKKAETKDFINVTEMAGENISKEQLQRMYNRYKWAEGHSRNKDVIEVACGSGQGLGLLSNSAKTLRAGDYSPEVLNIPKSHYKDRIHLDVFLADNMPYEDNSADVIIIFEAIYYLPNVRGFIGECKRVLRSGGNLLISIANKDLYDFNVSPFTYQYYGVKELGDFLKAEGFFCVMYGDTPVSEVSFIQKILRPIKKIAISLNLIPKSMKAKEWLKRVVFGGLVSMPAELEDGICEYQKPVLLQLQTESDTVHKVILCEARLT